MKNSHTNYKAITLIETCIYMGLFVSMFVGAVSFFFAISSSNLRSRAVISSQRFRIFVSENLDKSLEVFETVHPVLTVTGTDDGTLYVIDTDTSDGKVFYIDEGILYAAINGRANEIRLSPPDIYVTKLRLTRTEDTDTNLVFLQVDIGYYSTWQTTVTREYSYNFIVN